VLKVPPGSEVVVMDRGSMAPITTLYGMLADCGGLLESVTVTVKL